MVHLPYDIWREIFSYLLPREEIGWVSEPIFDVKYLDLHFAGNEKQDRIRTVNTLAYNADLFYKGSRDDYWMLLIEKAHWTIGASANVCGSRGGYIGSTRTLTHLQKHWGRTPQHLTLIINLKQQRFDENHRVAGLDFNAMNSAANVTLGALRRVMGNFKSLNIYLDLCASRPSEGMWVHYRTFQNFFLELQWNTQLLPREIKVGRDEHGKDIYVPWDFKVWMDFAVRNGREIRMCIRTAHCHCNDLRPPSNSFKPVVIEDVTSLWDDLPVMTGNGAEAKRLRQKYGRTLKAAYQNSGLESEEEEYDPRELAVEDSDLESEEEEYDPRELAAEDSDLECEEEEYDPRELAVEV